MLKRMYEVFWTDSWWLPSGYKWSDVTNGPDKKVVYPDSKDFLYQIPLTVLMLVARYLLEKYCYAPLGLALGIRKKKKRQLQDIPLLEAAYRKSPHLHDATGLAKQLDMTERQVERWWRLRRSKDKPSTLAKFCEHCWKATYLTCSTVFGFYMLWDKEWFWDLEKCFHGYPHQGVTNDVWWAYMLWSSFCWSAVITFFRDVRRKDFWQMFVHHVVTCILLSVSWITSMYRIGAVLMPMQDSSEAVLEITKAFKKAKFDNLCKVLFFIFAPMWFYTRVYSFPFQYFYCTAFKSKEILQPFPIGYALNCMLFLLLILTIYWSVLILMVIYNFLAHGIEQDVRSSSSDITDDEKISNNGHKNEVNGSGFKNVIEGTAPKKNVTSSRHQRDSDSSGYNTNGVNEKAHKNVVNDKKLS